MSTVSPAAAADRKRARAGTSRRPLGPAHCAAFKQAWKYERECRREWRQDPTRANLTGYIEAQRNTEFALYRGGDDFPVYCNTCGARDGRHTYHCNNDR